LLAASGLAALVEFAPSKIPRWGVLLWALNGDRRAVPSLLIWFFGIALIWQRAREDRRWPCDGLMMLAQAGTIACTLFALQCVIWREQMKYHDPPDATSVLPLAGAIVSLGFAAVGRWLTRRCSGPEPR